MISWTMQRKFTNEIKELLEFAKWQDLIDLLKDLEMAVQSDSLSVPFPKTLIEHTKISDL